MQFPTSPSAGDQFLAEQGRLYQYSANGWSIKNDLGGNPFLYRTIITRGYVSCGYKSGSPWRNINRCVHATDTTTNLGDLWSNTCSYKDGSFSDYHHYMYGMTGTHSGTGTYTGKFDMSTETEMTHTTAQNLITARQDMDILQNPGWTIAYICGGTSGTGTDKHNMVTGTMYTTGSPATVAGGTVQGVGVLFGQYKGWVSQGTSSSECGSLDWTTETFTSGGISWATDGQPKGLSSKHGHGYGATGTYGGSSTYLKFNDATGATVGSGVTRPQAAGEENQNLGQNSGYTLGLYNGSAQTNASTKLSYLTDTIVSLGATAQPKGHDGMSSGGCASASALVVGGN
jgi:hypothetical protein